MEAILFWEVNGKLYDPKGIGIGFYATTKPGAKLPSFDVITASIVSEQSVKDELAKCKDKQSERDARLYEEPLTKHKLKRGTKVVPGADFVYIIDQSKHKTSLLDIKNQSDADQSHNEITYDEFWQYDPDPEKNPKVNVARIKSRGLTIYDCYGRVVSSTILCKKSDSMARIAWYCIL